jgi:hypothetical protein
MTYYADRAQNSDTADNSTEGTRMAERIADITQNAVQVYEAQHFGQMRCIAPLVGAPAVSLNT